VEGLVGVFARLAIALESGRGTPQGQHPPGGKNGQ
jgi:hypothetical protein